MKKDTKLNTLDIMQDYVEQMYNENLHTFVKSLVRINKISERQGEWLDACVTYEEDNNVIFGRSFTMKLDDNMEFFFILDLIEAKDIDFLQLQHKELTGKEKIISLQKLKERFENKTRNECGLCAIMIKMFRDGILNVHEYLFLFQMIYWELKERKHTYRYERDYWLFKTSDSKSRVQFLSSMISLYEQPEYITNIIK